MPLAAQDFYIVSLRRRVLTSKKGKTQSLPLTVRFPSRNRIGVAAEMLTQIDLGTERRKPQLSVVVVAWRRDRDLPDCLRAIAQQTLPRTEYEVIVVDNGGNPLAMQTCRHLVDVWYDTGFNAGCSGGRNIGARLAMGEFIAFVDDDGVIRRDFLENGLIAIQKKPDIGGVRGRVIYRRHRYLTMLSGVYDLGPDWYDGVVLDCEGASLVKAQVFRALGGFDERLAGGEGLDWTVRLMTQMNMHVAYEPHMVMQHDYFDSVYRYITKVHMNRRGRLRQQDQSNDFSSLRPPPGLLRDKMPDKRPLLDRTVCRLGRYALRLSEWLPEPEAYRRK
jgi:GT2 family glycosyltransferase